MLLILIVSVIGSLSNFNVASSEETSYTCDFERDTCGFTNEEHNNVKWERMELEIGGRTGYAMVAEANGTLPQLAVMSSPYFEIHEDQPGCFTFDLYTSGNGVRRLSVEQEQDYGVVPVSVNSYETAGWHTPQVQVDIDASTRFIFTATLAPAVGESIVAVSKMSLKLSKC